VSSVIRSDSDNRRFPIAFIVSYRYPALYNTTIILLRLLLLLLLYHLYILGYRGRYILTHSFFLPPPHHTRVFLHNIIYTILFERAVRMMATCHVPV